MTTAGGLLILLLSACSSSNDTIMPPPGILPLPSIGIGVSGGANITRGSAVPVTVTVARLGGFTGSIDVSVEGLPAGVTAVFDPAAVPGSSTTSTLTLSASATATLGTVITTLRARATGVTDATTQLVIGVSP